MGSPRADPNRHGSPSGKSPLVVPCGPSHASQTAAMYFPCSNCTQTDLPWCSDIPEVQTATELVVLVEMDGGLLGLVCLEHYSDHCGIQLLSPDWFVLPTHCYADSAYLELVKLRDN